ncbi:probable disease resistance protein At4g14610 [Magnolia sinica]|uniref:probable disease resistance protein At4g14610 n=1 Tax=Magnolia sinica TaxID=86752 RepID=UPI002657F547|nr:probable disease resistance protein At4g14610 [Magnolia sinica]
MAASRDDDDRRLKGGGEVVSALSQRMSQRIWDCLRDDNISVFSVWGWQGVGKSRIVRQVVAAIEESRESSHLFDVIIRVRAPGIESLGEKMPYIIKGKRKHRLDYFGYYIASVLDAKGRRNRLMEVQMEIKEALDIPESIQFSTAAKRIKDKLSGQRFLLIFEDVWESFDLKDIGVSVTSSSKVVITTRSHENGSSIDRDSLIEEYWRSEGFLDGFFNEEENKEVAFKRQGNILLKEFAERCMVLLSLTSSNPNYLSLFVKETENLDLAAWDNHPKEAEFMNWVQEQFTMEESSGGQYHVDMNSHVRKVIGSRTFLVKNNLDAEEACQWISLSHNQVQTFQLSSPNCPLLSTLLLNDNDRLQEIPDSFFKNMTRL